MSRPFGLLILNIWDIGDIMVRKTKEELRQKAMQLPMSPGVYIMRSAADKIIYVGKSKVLRNRVSQYFSESEKTPKTLAMVNAVYDFDYMLTDTETEALALENKLIKLHTPKYNILLKDGKSYPYIMISLDEEYPRISITRKRVKGKAKYFGPYSSSFKANSVVGAVNSALGLPGCKRVFPRDIGKERPCIYKDIGKCCGVCSGELSREEYMERVYEAQKLLKGNFKELKTSLEEKMKSASRALAFEAAAKYRDRMNSLSILWDKQKVIGKPGDEYDVISVYTGDLCSCLAVYYVRDGAIIDSDNFIFTADKIIDPSSLASFVCAMYQGRENIPGLIFIGFETNEEQIDLMSEYLGEIAGQRVEVRAPQKGEFKKLCDMVAENARIHASQYSNDIQKDSEVLVKLASILSLEVVPERIEAVDISNYGDESITAGLIALENGKFDKKHYRLYKIRSTEIRDDYASMAEAIERRVFHKNEDPLPDLLLLDGGKGHVSVIKRKLAELGESLPVFGMVKDDFHKTRAITDGENEISIAREQSVFTFIYKIQEEVHRFSIGAVKKDKSRKITHSSLEKIDGIGKAKAKTLLEHFKNIKTLAVADIDEIKRVKGISERDAKNIRDYFDSKEGK